MSGLFSGGLDPVAFHASSRPSAVACHDLTSGKTYSYAQFSKAVDGVAEKLSSYCEGETQPRIAVVSRNCAEFAMLTIACERLGAVLVPLNWRLTDVEIAALLNDCTPVVLIRQKEFSGLCSDALAAAKVDPVVLDIQRDLPKKAKGSALGILPTEKDAPCIILYTSGTTGRPKGVVITRENALFSSLNFSAMAHVSASSVLLCDSPMFHTVGLVAITRTTLQQGGTVLMSDRFVPGQSLERLSDEALGVTHYFVVPQMIEALLADPGFEKADLTRLVALFSGGGPLPAKLVKACKASGAQLINGYGMSEAGSVAHVPVGVNWTGKAEGSVGFGAPYVDIRLEGASDASPSGEIWLRGPSVFKKYWRQPKATKATLEGEWFRTGDIGEISAGGDLVIVDRLKDMYISGGENVYPAEVERVIERVKGVLGAGVVGSPHPKWGEVGVAFVQVDTALLADSNGARSAALVDKIQQACAKNLAKFKTPRDIRLVSELPRTGSGKIQKATLRASL